MKIMAQELIIGRTNLDGKDNDLVKIKRKQGATVWEI